MNLIEISAVKALEMMDKGELTSEIYVQAFLDRIKKREPLVGAWTFIEPELALKQARLADKRRVDKNKVPTYILYKLLLLANALISSSTISKEKSAKIAKPVGNER